MLFSRFAELFRLTVCINETVPRLPAKDAKGSDEILWSSISVKIKVALHCADLFEFNVVSVAFSCRVAN